MKYKIKQIKNRNDYRFMNYDFAIKNGFNLNDYETVYEGHILKENGSINNTLETLFQIFNINRPEDFHGHSLSTSDVVELDGVNYYCDFAGWVKLD